MKEIRPLILYSCGTWLSWAISERYYSRYYVWCAPFFKAPSDGASLPSPASSTPYEIWRRLREDIDSKDHHSALIAGNRAGIIRGASARRRQGIITHKAQA